MTEKEKMLVGKIYDSSDKELAELRTKRERAERGRCVRRQHGGGRCLSRE